jgi:hypothetical protein
MAEAPNIEPPSNLVRLPGSKPVALPGGNGHPPGVDSDVAVLKYRADQADARMARVEDKLDRIGEAINGLRTEIARVPTRAEQRGQTVAVISTVVATAVAAVLALWQVNIAQTANERSAIANMLSSFQAGMAVGASPGGRSDTSPAAPPSPAPPTAPREP